jgi:hypothetical protein
MSTGRKHNAINIIELYFKGSANGWNDVMHECYINHDMSRLAKLMYALQAGMDDAAKAKLNNEKITVFYIRLLKSIEKTARAIIRDRHPNPRDNPLFAKNPELCEKKYLEMKRKRDHELELFMRKSSY